MQRSRTNCYDLFKMLESARSPDRNIIQRVIYIPGPATLFWDVNPKELALEGLTGRRLLKVVQALFKLILRQRWSSQDELVLIGWSRGAFALQLLAQFIGHFGFERFKRGGIPDFDKVEAVFDDLEKMQAPHLRVGPTILPENEILALGLFDTVGTIVGPDQSSHVDGRDAVLWGHVPGYIGPNVKKVFHAMAVDETLDVFRPTRIMPAPHRYLFHNSGPGTEMKEVWFSGCHEDVGGPLETSKESLRWMLSRCI